MNKVLLIGRLTKAPEMQEFGTNKIAKFGLAVNRRFKKEDQEADFFNIVTWNKQADLCLNYLDKGSQVAISGRVEIDKWQDKEGNNRYTTNIVSEEIEFLSKANTDNTRETKDKVNPKKDKPKKEDINDTEDLDLPF